MSLAIEDGLAVTVHYRLTLPGGTVVDDSFDDEPMRYVHGSESILPGLERGLLGLTVGEERDIVVEPGDGYGEIDPAAEREVPKSDLPSDFEIEPGAALQARGEGGVVQLWIKSVADDSVVLTANHPLAGEVLTFHVRVVDVQEHDGAAPET